MARALLFLLRVGGLLALLGAAVIVSIQLLGLLPALGTIALLGAALAVTALLQELHSENPAGE